MNARIGAVLTVVALVSLVGCPASPQSSGVTPTPVQVTPSNQAPAPWSQAQVEGWLKQDLKLTSLSLAGGTNGNYTGQGQDATGKTYQLTITQVPGGIACDHTSGPGSSGRITFGVAIPKPGEAPAQVTTVGPALFEIPESAASGTIHGQDFTVEKAVLENGVLTLRTGKDKDPDLALDVMLFIKQGESPEGKVVQIPADMAPGKPILRLQWRENGQRKTEDFLQKYTLVLNLGKLADGNLPGQIHAEFPDATKSKVSGTFIIEGVR